MTDQHTTLERIKSADTVPSLGSFPGGALKSAALLARIDREEHHVETLAPIRLDEPAKPPGRGRGPLLALAAAAVVLTIVGIAGFALVRDPAEPADSNSTTTSVVVTTTTTRPEDPTPTPESTGLLVESLPVADFVEWKELGLPEGNFSLSLLNDGTLIAFDDGWDFIEHDPIRYFVDGLPTPLADPDERMLVKSPRVIGPRSIWIGSRERPCDNLVSPPDRRPSSTSLHTTWATTA